jgi:methionyl-tRNA synthetase
MIKQYRKGYIPSSGPAPLEVDTFIRRTADAMDAFEFSKALEEIWSLISWADGYIVAQAPWKLAPKKDDEASQEALDRVLYNAAEILRTICVLLYPVLPDATSRIWSQLGMQSKLDDVKLDGLAWGQLTGGQSIGEIQPVFPRIDAGPAIEKMQQLEAEETKRQNALVGKTEAPAEAAQPIAPIAETINIDDFSKIDLRVGRVLEAGPLKGADKLLHLKVDIGEGQPRTILAGIAKHYEPSKLVGRKVVIVANLAPRKMRGLESQGMIVAASLEGGSPVLAGFLEDVPVGARLK